MRERLSRNFPLAHEERLISALSHSVREHRMIAIEVLGRLRSRRAVPVLAG